jgi:hypothetical protein
MNACFRDRSKTSSTSLIGRKQSGGWLPVAIQLDDIDWRAGEVLVRGKGQPICKKIEPPRPHAHCSAQLLGAFDSLGMADDAFKMSDDIQGRAVVAAVRGTKLLDQNSDGERYFWMPSRSFRAPARWSMSPMRE